MGRYTVGQVVYVSSSEQNKVMPLQIIEEITRKTLKGDEVHYKVVFGNDMTKTRYLSDIKGDVFTSLEAIRASLLKNATSWIDRQIEEARKYAHNTYKNAQSHDFSEMDTPQLPSGIHTPNASDDDVPGEEANLVELPDGRIVKARVKQVSK